jgi:chromosome segregation ATPase
MRSRRHTALLSLAGIAVVAALVLSSREITSRRRTFDQINTLRERLYEARRRAESCQRSLGAQERAFRRLDETVDSLRAAVSAFEALDERGVPEARYQEYLETFDSYNDSVSAWEAQAEALRAAEEACRTSVAAHNALRDSLQTRLEAAGIGG